MYNWRKLSDEDRRYLLNERKRRGFPWHAPPHFKYEGTKKFLISASCFEHKHIIGKSAPRMAECESGLIALVSDLAATLIAWCILTNHYHLLIETAEIGNILEAIGKFHGSTSYRWNGEDNQRGRQVWFRCVERAMRSERHFYATLNYVHHNPVKHGYVERWQDWPYSSANEFLAKIGKEEAERLWRQYPILEYGKEWDHD